MNSSIDISCKFVRYLLLRVLKMLKLHQAFWEILSLASSPFQDSAVMTRGVYHMPVLLRVGGCSHEPEDKIPTLTQL